MSLNPLSPNPFRSRTTPGRRRRPLRYRTALAALVCCTAAPVLLTAGSDPASAAAPTGFVHRSGTDLVTGTNAPLRLRGANLGGALMFEGWLWGQKINYARPMNQTEKTMMGRLARATTPARAEQFRQDVYASSITLSDFQRAKSLGFTVMRVPFNHELLLDDGGAQTFKSSGWAVLDRILGYAESAGVYVVLDLHSAPGGQSTAFVADPDRVTSDADSYEDGRPVAWLWSDPRALSNPAGSKARTVAIWKAIASRYSGRTIIAGYDLLNEPWIKDVTQLTTLYRDVIAGIRSVDRNHLVITEGNAKSAVGPAAQDFTSFGRWDDNQAWSFHQYAWFDKNADETRADLAPIVTAAQNAGIPLWNGEFGEDTPSKTATSVSIYDSAAASGVDGWAFWPWRKVPSGSDASHPALSPIDLTAAPQWQTVLAYLAAAGPDPAPPSAAVVEQGMRQFVAALQAPRTLNTAMSDALRVTG